MSYMYYSRLYMCIFMDDKEGTKFGIEYSFERAVHSSKFRKSKVAKM